MIELTQEELKQHFSEPIFGQISETADALGLECYVVGGYVRDIFLQRPSKDIDVVVVGSGIAMAVPKFLKTETCAPRPKRFPNASEIGRAHV